ncbi:electron transfer flavoprotein subunit beta/FixA family protein [Paenibacillus sp. GSMTC-2017]|uniref:electron transfer flavoprotein subunit beta/FixA family protein n=1 Tax=Paenibacillus sp. GSMTC-2017 TaxID=2794350 RepID=UPI0018D664F3|nr:electron transfer flavoprotein subunit beta/FixA family protein [Paenibacillus sp. GSMTC-2017]MBH5318707.1 electron transfer flavoprotein subunit beta/FixA family protein [Paenibacillus sp. GSMTC-2017]
MKRIVVLLKRTFDTEEKVIVTSQGVDEKEAKFVINPYDEYALEEALRLKEKHGGEVIVLTCGKEGSQETIRTALAIGADEAIHIDAEGLPDDGFSIAAALAAVIAPLSPDLLLAGLFAIDTGSGSVALQIAERLGLPHASAALKITIAQPKELGIETASGVSLFALVEHDIEGDSEQIAIPLPALITAQQGLNEPRYPSLPGIMKAKRKPLRTVTLQELNLVSSNLADITTARTERVELFPPPPRGVGKQLNGTPNEQALELVKLLQTEAKVL